MKEFKNEAFTDFSAAANAKAMTEAIEKVKAQFGREYPLIIGGEKVTTGEWITSTNPSKPAEVLGKFAKAGKDQADLAMNKALAAFETWKKVSPADRAEYLFKAADVMRKKKHELSAWMILESPLQPDSKIAVAGTQSSLIFTRPGP